jgi:hypothetical protein
MEEYDFDLITIGAGSGGVRASRVASKTYGAKVWLDYNLNASAKSTVHVSMRHVHETWPNHPLRTRDSVGFDDCIVH